MPRRLPPDAAALSSAPEARVPGAHLSGYRPHLDGLRAVAVVAVILFHLGYGWIPGGFVGVDVFFVLSGYLITGILLGEIDAQGTVRLGRFYARRVRRLLPASIVVLAVVMVTAWHLLDAVDRHGVGRDAVFAALYSANWRFALAGGDYFAPGDVPSPLVHYWSLAVEEQFYFVWPALILAVHRGARRVRPGDPLPIVLGALGALLAVSATLSIALAGTPLTYYGTHTRAYQLIAGGVLALVVRRWRPRFPDTGTGRAAGTALAVAGLGVLGVLAHRIPDANDYPGWPGVWVTVASLAVIAGIDLTPAGWATRALGIGPAAAIGRLSYSLYIWHWPAIVLLPLAATRWGGPLSAFSERWAQVLAIVAGALASYLIVERPFRFRLHPAAPPWRVAATGLACSMVVAAVAFVAFRPDGEFERRALAAVKDLAKPGSCPYFKEDWPAPADSHPCLLRDGTGPTIAVVGDSHGQQWQPAIAVLADRVDARVIRATRGGCPANDVTPFLRSETGQVQVEDDCTAWRHQVYPEVVSRYDPDFVLVATRSHVRGLRVDGDDLYPNRPPHLAAWSQGWEWTLDTLTAGGAQVLVSEILPTMPMRIPACLVEHGEGTTACDFPASVDPEVVPYNAAIAAFDGSRSGRVHVAKLVELACPGGECRALDGEVVIHRDDNHLSATFVRTHADALATILRAAGAPL